MCIYLTKFTVKKTVILWNNIPIEKKCFLFEYFKCNLFLWCKAEFSASLLSVSLSFRIHSMLICSSRNVYYYYYYYQCWKQSQKPIYFSLGFFDEQKVQKNSIFYKPFCNTVNVTCDQFNFQFVINASLLNKSINFFQINILLTPNF